jgi:hypothetical protein
MVPCLIPLTFRGGRGQVRNCRLNSIRIDSLHDWLLTATAGAALDGRLVGHELGAAAVKTSGGLIEQAPYHTGYC